MKCREEILIDDIKRGDRGAQKLLYTTYAGRLLSVALRYVGRRDVAEDMLHDAFIKIFGSIDRFQYRGEGSLQGWMSRITINLSLEWLRTNKRINSIELDSDYREQSTMDEPRAEEVERIPKERLMQFVGELPDGYRAVFNMFCIEGYSHREIAEVLKINEKSSSSQLLRAKRLLARRINEYMKNE